MAHSYVVDIHHHVLQSTTGDRGRGASLDLARDGDPLEP